MFTSNQNKGFSMTFDNGLTISVQFGVGNYCERRSFSAHYGSEMKECIINSKDAEIAIWDEKDTWFKFSGDTVEGFCSTNDVAKWIERTSKATSIETV